ncbi:hypothetical protein EDC94DRAFT_611568 [Helicostylum pulchrum]|nr:hypothetical protein EDC94DRAFT_611568 [Helicostylum pulchrum]
MSFQKPQGKKEGGGTSQNKNRGTNNNKKWLNNNNNSPARQQQADTIVQDQATMKVMHDRMLFLLGNLTGTLVEATVKDGSKFKGIFHGASTEGDLGIALKLAQKTFDPSAQVDTQKTNPNPIKSTLLIFSKDLVEVTAVDVDFSLTESAVTDRHTFKTDADISGKMDIKQRELHRWTPTEDENPLGLLEGDLETSTGGSWDQFAANEKLFGLTTDFNEEIYTTTLNRSAPGYKDREKKAIKMANEIQKTSSTNVHMLEERGMVVDDSGLDEEDLYGAVVRDTTNPNKYVPPALRKPVKKESKTPLNKLITSDLPKATGSNPSPIANLPTTRRESSEKNSENVGTKKSVGPPKRIEAEIANTFKHFAMMEKDKLHAKKQALQKKEKDGRLAELKMFHQTFKLNVPIPADLVPLLSLKGKKTTEATTTTATNTTTAPVPVPEKKKTVTTTSPPVVTKSPTPTPTPAPINTTAPTAVAAAPPPPSDPATSPTNSSSFKFNVKASSFKPNPTAAAFVPGGAADKSLKKKPDPNQHLTMTEAFVPSFIEKDIHPSAVGPTWPFGTKSYRVQFNQYPYEEDVFTGYPSPNYAYGYPQYRYPQYVQGMPPMAVQQGPYMNPQFVQNVPISAPMPPNGGPPGYSPQMANVSPHGSPFPQGFPSPQRSPMVPQGMQHQVYQYQGGPMMMRYPPEMMQNNGGPVMMQRPVMVENMQYSPHHQHDTLANDSGTETPPTN